MMARHKAPCADQIENVLATQQRGRPCVRVEPETLTLLVVTTLDNSSSLGGGGGGERPSVNAAQNYTYAHT